MLSQLFSAIYSETFTPEIYFICTAVSLVLGAVIAFTAGFRAKQSKSFLLALFLIGRRMWEIGSLMLDLPMLIGATRPQMWVNSRVVPSQNWAFTPPV